VSWQQRWNSARQANNSAALQALLREDLALGYDMKQLTPEEKAKWTQLAQDEYQKWVQALQEAFTSGKDIIHPPILPPFIMASDQPPGTKIPHRYAFTPVELMRALNQTEPINPITQQPFAKEIVAYLRTKFALPIKLCP